MNITIYHNPRCSKSRRTLEIIRKHGIEPHIVEYLKTAPGKTTLLGLASRLDVPVSELLRKNEDEYRAAADALSSADDEELAEWLASHPASLQRPVVVDEDSGEAVIGRPPENVLDLLPKS